MITKAERAQLATLLRARFKVLRADVRARQAELQVELEHRVKEKFAVQDKTWNDAMFLVRQAADEANRKANDLLRGTNLVEDYPTASDYQIVIVRPVNPPKDGRGALLRDGTTRIEAKVKAAFLELDRQENELLTKLLVGALESEEARAFFGEIPTVSSLVPADRLLALVGPIDVDTEG